MTYTDQSWSYIKTADNIKKQLFTIRLDNLPDSQYFVVKKSIEMINRHIQQMLKPFSKSCDNCDFIIKKNGNESYGTCNLRDDNKIHDVFQNECAEWHKEGIYVDDTITKR